MFLFALPAERPEATAYGRLRVTREPACISCSHRLIPQPEYRSRFPLRARNPENGVDQGYLQTLYLLSKSGWTQTYGPADESAYLNRHRSMPTGQSVQVLSVQTWSELHIFPQDPQLKISSRLVHDPEQQDSPGLQVFPQDPQFSSSSSRFLQTRSSHHDSPGGHPVQTPLMQDSPWEQWWRHSPQFSRSVRGSVQAESKGPSNVGQAIRPPPQSVQVPASHIRPEGQAFPHPPQLP